MWPEVKEFVDQAYEQYPKLKLFLCGHSLGGALANICLAYFTFTDSPRVVDAVYTVGQPHAGNKFFREQLELAAPKTTYIRMTNNQDCVPVLAGGQHCGIHVHFDVSGRPSFVSIKNHKNHKYICKGSSNVFIILVNNVKYSIWFFFQFGIFLPVNYVEL